jgi:transposase
MHTPLPLMSKPADTLKPRVPREPAGRKKPRLHMLDVLARGPAQTRREVAQLLGVHRHTIGRWLALYDAGGLAALLDVYLPAGKPLSLPPEGLATMAPALRQPAGLASDKALRQ